MKAPSPPRKFGKVGKVDKVELTGKFGLTTVVLQALAVLTLVVFTPASARAQDDKALARATGLNVKALEAYDGLDFDKARKLLKEALEVCAKSGLEKHPIAARTHLHMGVVLIVGLKQEELGVKQFQKALEIKPDIEVTKSLANPEVTAAFDKAAGSSSGPAGPPDAPDGTGGDRPIGAPGGTHPPSRPMRDIRRPKRCDPDDEDCEEDRAAAGPSLFFGAAGGRGFGYATGNGETYVGNKVTPGFAPASLLHVAPEVGYFLSANLRLSLQVRFQVVSGATPVNLDALARIKPGTNVNACGTDHLCSPKTSALAVLARASWFFGEGSIRPYASAALGGGQIRHVVAFKAQMPICGMTGMLTCVDTVLAGPVFVGPGAGVLIGVSENFGFILEAQSVLGFPKFTFNIDLSAGLALRI